jgi:catechol 2,3-dioxygenase-like lactoylglutathione lyase family enzyme
MVAFYAGVLGLELISSEDGWREFATGACRIALHKGKSVVGSRPPKLVFYADDVAQAREELVARLSQLGKASRGRAKLGKVLSTGRFEMCDGKDPDGNSIQISGRE